MTERVLVVIPTYNESTNIEQIVARVHDAQPAMGVLIVDDGSPDGTGKIADLMAERDARINVLHRSQKSGLGGAYVAGFDWGLDAGYEVLVEMDADGSHAPEQLGRLLAALRGTGTGKGADLVLGSRWVPGGAVVNWPRSRELLSRGGNLYSRIALGVEIRDITGGYRAYRREVLEGIDYSAVVSEGYCFQVDLAWRALRAGFRVVEVPITFAERERGESKMSNAIVREALLRVTQWGIKMRARQLRAAMRGDRR
jgi:dolichol-phosphate mannosyltransferase